MCYSLCLLSFCLIFLHKNSLDIFLQHSRFNSNEFHSHAA
uniref:Uncharacterized protein n=1 Tax=Anguilla anguilla TaxID=7936 RepID=A0A0E9PM14_ANGAN